MQKAPEAAKAAMAFFFDAALPQFKETANNVVFFAYKKHLTCIVSYLFVWYHSFIILVYLRRKQMEERQTCDLAGLWRFEIDKEDRGFAEHWEKRRLTQTITLPGCLQAQGYGDAISEDTPWVQSLYDALWYQRGEYAYAQENGTKVPFLSQPPRHYTGKAWYQKTIFVPEKSDGFVGRLTLENTKWKTTLWIDGECKGSIVSLCAPHVYETGALSAGEHTVTLCIDNGWQLPYRPDGQRKCRVRNRQQKIKIIKIL